MRAADSLVSACIFEIFPFGQTQSDCLLVKGQHLHSGLVADLSFLCIVNQNIGGAVAVNVMRDIMRVFFLGMFFRRVCLSGCSQAEHVNQNSDSVKRNL